MSEIYWLTRLDSISTCSLIVAIICGIVVLFVAIPYIICKSDYMRTGTDKDKSYMMCFWMILKPCLIALLICVPLRIFTPTSKEAMFIWGVGGTIDYIKNNETAKKLPDKCINALDAWVESLGDENKKE